MPPLRVLRTLVLAAAVLGAGCASPFGGAASGYSEEELREELHLFATEFQVLVASAAETIAERSDDREVRRRTLIWKLHMIPLVQEATQLVEPQAAYVATLGYAVMMRDYLVDGDGSALFGEQQPLAVARAREIVDAALAIGEGFLDEQQRARLATEVEDIARRYPIRGPNFAITSRQTIQSDPTVMDRVGWIVDLPMAPLRALQGVGSTPEAIREFTRTADAFSDVVERLPQELRWQAELLAYDLEGRDTTTEALEGWTSLATSLERTSLAIDGAAAELRALLEQPPDTVVEATALLREARAVADALAPAAAEVAAAGAAWDRLIARDDDGGPDEPAGRPFDVREYEAAAREIGTASAELRALVDELDAAAGSSALDDRLARVDASVDHAAWRGGQLLVLGFALLIVWRMVPPRRARDRAS